MSEVDLEAMNQQALKQSQERATKTSAASPNVNFAVQLKSASNVTNAKQRAAAASAGINATGQSVISAAVKARGQTKALTQQSPTAQAAQQKTTQAQISTNTNAAGNSKLTQASPTATSVVNNTTTSASSSGDAVLSSTSSDSSSAALLQATNQMQEMNQQFNLQYLQLQENSQSENRQFTSLSNVSKLRSDTAKNSISNLK